MRHYEHVATWTMYVMQERITTLLVLRHPHAIKGRCSFIMAQQYSKGHVVNAVYCHENTEE